MAFLPTALPLARALTERNYNDPTPVQTAVLEPDAAERDLLVSAQTGSGKTVAYGLAIASTLLGDAELMDAAGDPVALIVAPTRELALQVHRELSWLYEHAGATIASCVGGMDPKSEARRLNQGAHIVVGTPGRLRDHLERGRLKIGNIKAVVLDEADEMLDLGFREDLEFILEATPKERRTLMFSATLPKGIVVLAKRYQRNAYRIQASSEERSHADIEYRAIAVAAREMHHAVVNVLRFIESPSTIVFCNTREAVRHLQTTLQERGFSAVSLSGELSQGERNHALQSLRDGRARVCVATDVAARGIDLPNLDLVIHADLPNDAEVLQHRSGRTGRAGRKGVSVLLVPASRRRRAEQLLATARIKPNWGVAPTADMIRKLDQERLLQSPLLTAETNDDDLEMAKALLAERSPETIASALVRIYRSQLPAPEELSEAGSGREASNSRDRHERREPREPRETFGARKKNGASSAPKSSLPGKSVWFQLNVGRQKNADPRWLLPMICRQGKITKQEIGAIKISERETRFEIDEDVAERFIAAVRQVPKGDVRIELASDDTEHAPAHTGERKPHARPPVKPHSKGPWKARGANGSAEAVKPAFAGKPKKKKPKQDRPA